MTLNCHDSTVHNVIVVRFHRCKVEYSTSDHNSNITANFLRRYIKIQSETKDIISRLWGIPRDDAFCLELNFHISKVGYCSNKTLRNLSH